MTLTLEAIKAEHAKVAEMIATFEAQAKAEAAYPITVTFPSLNPGEHYLGSIISAGGTKRHHVILLPGEIENADWNKSMEWAAEIGGDLPDRIEQAVLLSCMKDQFKEAAYWSNTQHAAGSAYAWYQDFGYGDQFIISKSAQLRARAVRRLEIY
jgi:hypothetical protein